MLLALGGLAITGFEEDLVVEVITVAGTVLAALVVVPAAEFAYYFLRAPLAIARERIRALEQETADLRGRLGIGVPRPSFEEALEHAQGRLAEGTELRAQLVAAQAIGEVAQLSERLRQWELDTALELRRYHDSWEGAFGWADFDAISPTNRQELQTELDDKLDALREITGEPEG